MAESVGGLGGGGVAGGVLARRHRCRRYCRCRRRSRCQLLLLLLLLGLGRRLRRRLRLRHRAGSGTLLTPVVLAVGARLGRRAPRSPLALAAAAAAAAAVGLDVLREMVAAHEPLVADRAGESLFAGVGSKVPLQLIRTCEPLATEKPVANKRSLTSVPP